MTRGIYRVARRIRIGNRVVYERRVYQDGKVRRTFWKHIGKAR